MKAHARIFCFLRLFYLLGWTPSTLKVGMTVSVTGNLARDGSHKVNIKGIVADGIPLTVWPSQAGIPKR